MQPQIKDQGLDILVKVDPPQLKTQLGGASKFYQYHIHGKDKFSEFSIYRRYSDFIILKNSMMTRWPGVYIPPLPQKKFIGNNDTQFVDYRRLGLEQFLILISQVDFLWYADQFQLFIKNNSRDVEKSLNNLGKNTFKEISIKYEKSFSQNIQKLQLDQPSQGLTSKLLEFKSYLKNAQMLLQKMAKVSDSMADARRKFQDKYTHFLDVFLPDYEQKCVKNYINSEQELSQHLYFHKDSTQNLQVEIKQLINTFSTHGKQIPGQSLKSQYSHNALSIINQLIKEQIRQLMNFTEIFGVKQTYDSLYHKSLSKVKDLELQQSKITAGRQSIVSKLKNQNKEQQMKNVKINLEKARKEQQEIEKVCRLIDIVLVKKQIERFKQKRVENYYKIVRMMANAEKQMSQAEGQLWNRIAGFQGGLLGIQNVQNLQKQEKTNRKIQKQMNFNEKGDQILSQQQSNNQQSNNQQSNNKQSNNQQVVDKKQQNQKQAQNTQKVHIQQQIQQSPDKIIKSDQIQQEKINQINEGTANQANDIPKQQKIEQQQQQQPQNIQQQTQQKQQKQVSNQ